MDFRQSSKAHSEIVIGIIGPIGCNRTLVIDTLKNLAPHYAYEVDVIKVSDLIKAHSILPPDDNDHYVRVTNLISAGNEIRKGTGDNAIMSKLAAMEISARRKVRQNRNVIYLVDSIKRPEEIEELRDIYGLGFYLFAIHSSTEGKETYLINQCHILDPIKRARLIAKDRDEKIGHGQSTSEAFHRADFFLPENGDGNRMWNMSQRFLDIIFGDPFRTPTFNEYAMFMAYAAGARSGDMSRQVGAVVARKKEIISSGANECPRPGGGTYWPIFNNANGLIIDEPGGRDFVLGVDRNAEEKARIIDALKQGMPAGSLDLLSENIRKSGINDITEYGRVVHAEMDAILSCARRGVACEGADLFCTTFPCHNCAKHIVASGLRHVYYVEPYAKSKAFDMHPDAIKSDGGGQDKKVSFLPFVGVGPRQFLNLFSLTLSAGEPVRRKERDSVNRAEWRREAARPRVKSFGTSHTEHESVVATEANNLLMALGKVQVVFTE